ncbi:MAG: hypothetical protein M1438_20695 [Deltaproteobacteria bacterium]|nr:hypothetical protein [Deltaproteobacteria bacterium]
MSWGTPACASFQGRPGLVLGLRRGQVRHSALAGAAGAAILDRISFPAKWTNANGASAASAEKLGVDLNLLPSQELRPGLLNFFQEPVRVLLLFPMVPSW